MARKRTTKGKGRRADHHIRIRSIRRDTPDISKLSRALIGYALAQAQVEADAQAVADQATGRQPQIDGQPSTPEATP